MLLCAVLGCEEEAGCGALPFPLSHGLSGEQGDDGEVFKCRPWRPSEKFRKRAEIQREFGEDLEEERDGGGVRKWGRSRVARSAPGAFLERGKRGR